MKLIKGIFKIVVGLLALIGAFTVIPRFLPLQVLKAQVGEEVYVHFVSSPNASMKAAIVSYSGGGGISPFCSKDISILPVSASEAEAKNQKFVVFTAECDDFAARGLVEAPVVEWLSDRSMKITGSINSTAADPGTVKMKKVDLSGRVAIQYEFHE